MEGLDVRTTSVQPFLFAAPCAEAKRTFWLTRFVHDGAELPTDFHHAGGARRVVNGALSVVDGVVVAADDHDLRGFATYLAARDVDRAFFVVGHVDDHLQHTRWSGGVENRLLENLTGVFGHGDEGKLAWNAASVRFAHLVDSTPFEDGDAVVGFNLAAVGVFVHEDETCKVVFSGQRKDAGVAAHIRPAADVADASAG